MNNYPTDSRLFACPLCGNALIFKADDIICEKCPKTYAKVKGDIAVFNGCVETTDFFEKQAVERLSEKYLKYSYAEFKESLDKRELVNMDLLNKKVGITRKLWWEEHIGPIGGKDVLEVGCGVNYLVPYWLHAGNRVTAFDVCEESVFLTKSIVTRMGLATADLRLFVGDAEKIAFSEQFDIINVNNVLHHVKDKKRVLGNLKKWLKKDGKLMIVEPNYYYPSRWIVQTEVFDPVNFVKTYFQRHDLMEEGEKAIIFSELKSALREAGFTIDVEVKDRNYLGYCVIYFLDNSPGLVKLIYKLDKCLFSKLLPRILAPFEYLIASAD